MARLANSVPIHPPTTPPSMPDWTPATPLRVVTGYQNIARSFFEAKGFTNVRLLGADGALEAAPLMGSADVILDLVSTGVTLRENNLKQLDGGTVMQSQGILVANRAALVASPALLDVVHELIERLDAHLKADGFLSVVANMRAASADEVAARLLECDELRGLEVGEEEEEEVEVGGVGVGVGGGGVGGVVGGGGGGWGGGGAAPVGTARSAHLPHSPTTPHHPPPAPPHPPCQGPTISPVYSPAGGSDLWAATICVPKARLYDSVKDLRKARHGQGCRARRGGLAAAGVSCPLALTPAHKTRNQLS